MARKIPAEKFPRAERVHTYARAVVAGKITAGRYVRAAARRHLDDLARTDLAWRPEKAEAALGFFEEVLHLKPGVPFALDDFQAFIIGSLFGWYAWRSGQDISRAGSSPQRDREMRRRFRTFYGEMGKGNGKTPLAAGIGLYGLTIDTEHAPEIYAAAAAKDQARICFNDAKAIVAASPLLRGAPGGIKVEVLTNNLSVPSRRGKFGVLSSEDKGHHGLRVHMGLLDEIHAHGSAAMIDTIEAGTKNCRNALIALITNSGHDRRSACWHYHTRALEMLRGKPDDDLFAYVCTLDPCPQCEAKGKTAPDPKCPRCDDWRDPAVWKKANPGLGTILDEDYLRRRVHLAQRMTSKLNNVLQLNFCLWTESSNGWADMHAWRNLCHEPGLTLAQFKGRPCWLGLDAANRVDATCLAILFEREPGAGTLDPAALPEAARAALAEAGSREQGAGSAAAGIENQESKIENSRPLSASGYALFLRTYVPAALVANTSAANHEAYQLWKQQGHLVVTEGASTDFARIEDDIRQLATDHELRRLQADPRELGYLLQRVTTWAGPEVCVQVSQGPTMISQPMKEFEGLVASGLIKHDGNPVLDWMLGNVEQKTSRSGGPVKYYYPTRPTESQKIDAVPAALMALDGALRTPATAPEPGMVVLG